MNKTYKNLYRFYLSVSGSIALWPSVIALGLLVLGFCTSYLERTSFVTYLEKNFLFWLNTEPENARLILSTVASGTITLMVFSFSMVMIVLSQATSNLTPRVVPGLISDKMNQVVLGVNIGTILYTIILILSFKPGEENESVPVMGILLSVLLSISCVGLFVYFIHSISRAIKPDTILTRIYATTLTALQKETISPEEEHSHRKIEIPEPWFFLHSLERGYLRVIETESLIKLAKKENLVFEVMTPIDKFIVEGYPFLRVNQDIQGNKTLLTQIQDCFIFNLEEIVDSNFENGLRQISEVGVKALSPGINDPGTALSALDILTLLFIERMKSFSPSYFYDDQDQLRVINHPASLEDLLYQFLTPLRTYGKGDVLVMRKILLSLQNTLYAALSRQQDTAGLLRQVRVVRDDIHEHIKNRQDRAELDKILSAINKVAPDQEIPLLSTTT